MRYLRKGVDIFVKIPQCSVSGEQHYTCVLDILA